MLSVGCSSFIYSVGLCSLGKPLGLVLYIYICRVVLYVLGLEPLLPCMG